MQSGKNTTADMFIKSLERRGKTVEVWMYAGELKEFIEVKFKPLMNLLNTYAEKYPEAAGDLRLTRDSFYENKTDISRLLLGIVGTDIFRKEVDINHWVNKVVARIQKSKADVFLLTDFRFPNEYSVVADTFGKDIVQSIRVYKENSVQDGYHEQYEHSSECSLDDWVFDYEIQNDGTLDELSKKVEILIDKYFGNQ